MRPKYQTTALVLARTPLAEASALLYLLTHDFGLVKARAQGIRKAGAKLAAATQTFSEHEATLVRGKEGWRLSGAVVTQNWFTTLGRDARCRAGRIARLLLRLVHGESNDTALLALFTEFLEALPRLTDEDADAAEHLVALRLLGILGLDTGDIPGNVQVYEAEALTFAKAHKRELITRINRGIAASGL